MIRVFFRKGGWAVLILLLAAGLFEGLALWQGATARALDDHGVGAVATIERMRIHTREVRTNHRTRTETDYFVTYAFEAPRVAGGPSQSRRVEHDVPGWLYEELQTGQEVEVRYLPENPERIDFFPGEVRRSARLFTILAGVFALAAAAFGAVAGSAALRVGGQGTARA
jgi:Protein of unknown function (DUF3592)